MKAAPLILALLLGAAQAHESPIDHVERTLDLSVEEGRLCLGYRLLYTDHALVMQLLDMDANNDGRLSDEERAAWSSAFAAKLAGLFSAQVDGQPLRFEPVGAMHPDGRLGQTYQFAAPLGKLAPGRHTGVLVDGYSRLYPGAFRWPQPGEGKPGDIRVETLPETASVPAGSHPAWIELKFAIVVPE